MSDIQPNSSTGAEGSGAVAATILTTPVDEASVWDGESLEADPGWRYRMTAAEITELASATASVKALGLEVGQFDRDEFPLPLLGPRIESMVDQVENGRGVAMLHGLPIDDYDEASLRLMYWGFGVHAGQPVSQNSKGQLLAEVSDRGNEYGNRNTRGFSTNAELLPHVDTSDMTALLCVRDAREGGESRVVSSTAVYNAILSEHPEYLDVLYRGFYNDLRGEGPTGEIDELTRVPIPVYSYHAGRVSCSLNTRMIENAATKRGVPLTTEEKDALAFVRELTLRDELSHWFRLQPGDIQMVSNHSVFHSRKSFVDHDDPSMRRCLYRLWMNVRDGRPLAANFADRYNTGPRGGVAVGDGAQYAF